MACGFERLALRAVRLRECLFAAGERVGGGAAIGFRAFDLAGQRLALLGEHRRRVFQPGALALGVLGALLERGDLGARAVAALGPAREVGGNRLQAAVGHLGVAHDRLLLGADLGNLGALAGDGFAHGGELLLDVGGGRETGERTLRPRSWRQSFRRCWRSGGCALPRAPRAARSGG